MADFVRSTIWDIIHSRTLWWDELGGIGIIISIIDTTPYECLYLLEVFPLINVGTNSSSEKKIHIVYIHKIHIVKFWFHNKWYFHRETLQRKLLELFSLLITMADYCVFECIHFFYYPFLLMISIYQYQEWIKQKEINNNHANFSVIYSSSKSRNCNVWMHCWRSLSRKFQKSLFVFRLLDLFKWRLFWRWATGL